MAVGTPVHHTTDYDGVDRASYDSVSITATDASHQFAVVTTRDPVTIPIPTVTGGGVTAWTRQGAGVELDFASSGNDGRFDFFRAYQSTYGAAAVVSIAYSATVRGCGWTIGEVPGADPGGTNGAAGVAQVLFGGETAHNANPTITLAALAGSGSMAIGAFGSVRTGGGTAQVPTVGPGFTLLGSAPGGGAPRGSMMSEYKANETAVEVDIAIGDDGWGGCAVEFKESGGAPPPAPTGGPPPAPLPRVSLHDESFREIGELTQVQSVNRSFVLGEAGLAEVVVAETDPLIRFTRRSRGTVMVIRSELYPFPWVGAVERPAARSRDGLVTLQAIGYEAILSERSMPNSYATGLDAGAELVRALQTVNAQNNTGIVVGLVRRPGVPVRDLSFPAARALVAIDSIAEAGGLEWWLSHEVNQQTIIPRFNAAPSRGFDQFAQVTLEEGASARWTEWLEEGAAAIFAVTVTAGQVSIDQEFSERVRVTRVIEEGGDLIPQVQPLSTGSSGVITTGDGRKRKDSSINFAHGFARQGEVLVQAPTTRKVVTQVREELRTEQITAQVAESLLVRKPIAERVLRVDVFDTALWRTLTPGDVVRGVFPTAFRGEGFDGPVRIMGTNPDEEEGIMPTVVELLRKAG